MLLNLTHIGQIALPVSDVDRSEAFYKDVLGLPKLFRFGDLTFFDCAGVRLLLEKSREAFKPQGCIYFRCADIALTVAELTRRGIAFKHQASEGMTSPFGRFAAGCRVVEPLDRARPKRSPR